VVFDLFGDTPQGQARAICEGGNSRVLDFRPGEHQVTRPRIDHGRITRVTVIVPGSQKVADTGSLYAACRCRVL
jgi:hypothetical protein